MGSRSSYLLQHYVHKKGYGINALKDLKGKKMAFENPGSTSSFYIPVATVDESGS
jgi:ABC-type phosphate/phosphonate transport system substrate-binding protein